MTLVDLVVRRFENANVTELGPNVVKIELHVPLEANDFERVYDSIDGFWAPGVAENCLIPLNPKELLVGGARVKPGSLHAQEQSAGRPLVTNDRLLDPASGTQFADLISACNVPEMLELIGERFRIEYIGRLRLDSVEANVVMNDAPLSLQLSDLVTPLFALVLGGEIHYAVIPIRSALDTHHAFLVQAALIERGITPGAVVTVNLTDSRAYFEKIEYVDPGDMSSAEVTGRIIFEPEVSEGSSFVASFQANTVEHVFSIVQILKDGPSTRAVLIENMPVVGRQVSYYLDIAVLLGLVETGTEKGPLRLVALSKSGNSLAHAKDAQRVIEMLSAISTYAPLRDAILVSLTSGLISEDRAAEVVRKYDPRLGKGTNTRRASALRSWTRWSLEEAARNDLDIREILTKGQK